MRSAFTRVSQRCAARRRRDIASILATLLAIALPIVGALVAVLLTLAILVMARAIVRRLRARRPVTMASA
jgi:hypothetical protein